MSFTKDFATNLYWESSTIDCTMSYSESIVCWPRSIATIEKRVALGSFFAAACWALSFIGRSCRRRGEGGREGLGRCFGCCSWPCCLCCSRCLCRDCSCSWDFRASFGARACMRGREFFLFRQKLMARTSFTHLSCYSSY